MFSRSTDDRFGEGTAFEYRRPRTAPLPQKAPIKRSLASRQRHAMKNQEMRQQEKREAEERERAMAKAKAELHAKVQADRARRRPASRAVSACQDNKREIAQDEHMMLQYAIDITNEVRRHDIETKVRAAKMHAAGRVEAACARLLAANRASRQAVASEQEFALEEKARRLAIAKFQGAQQYLGKFENAPKRLTEDWSSASDAVHKLLSTGGSLQQHPLFGPGGGTSIASAKALMVRGSPRSKPAPPPNREPRAGILKQSASDPTLSSTPPTRLHVEPAAKEFSSLEPYDGGHQTLDDAAQRLQDKALLFMDF